jgi:hypothetical protein
LGTHVAKAKKDVAYRPQTGRQSPKAKFEYFNALHSLFPNMAADYAKQALEEIKIFITRPMPIHRTGFASFSAGAIAKSVRYRGPAMLGGPVNSPRSTAAINGTEMRRKH